ncbi:MAG: FGGY-family carbohydrate kinase [Eubacteriales bacterium]
MILAGQTSLGIEFGSTRIKAVLIGQDNQKIASGSHTWENRLEAGMWTYTLDDIWGGLRACYKDLSSEVKKTYGIPLETVGAMGVSAMMHGYLAFDGQDQLLVPFRTWRNTCTAEAAKQLTDLFGFNIPQRWSIAHLYQAILNQEEHVSNISYITTLAGYIHYQLTGESVLGIGDASGMFPIDNQTRLFDAEMMAKFDALDTVSGLDWTLADVLPSILPAGEEAGRLTEKGAKAIDPTGTLKAGALMCPPEGDAGTGMVATNSVRQRTGNISAGTSVFAMAVLEKSLSQVHTEIDMVTTPCGDPVAMVHCNNFLGDIDAWVKLFGEAARAFGSDPDADALYGTLYNLALEGEADGGNLMANNYISGEHVTGFSHGCPMFLRLPDANFSLANFMRVQLYAACASLKIGMDILFGEQVELDIINGHGGFFKVPLVGQKIMAAALGTPISVMATAGDGGPWGIAVLASYMINGKDETLPDYLSKNIFNNAESSVVAPSLSDQAGYNAFIERYKASLAVEQAAVTAYFD